MTDLSASTAPKLWRNARMSTTAPAARDAMTAEWLSWSIIYREANITCRMPKTRSRIRSATTTMAIWIVEMAATAGS